MDKTTIRNFYIAYGHEVTAEEMQLINDMLLIWKKTETATGRNPAMMRKGIQFGMMLARGIDAGVITLRPVKKKRQAVSETAGAKTETAE